MTIRSQTREVASFSRLNFSGVGELLLSQGERESLVIEADDEVLSEIRSEVRGDTLHIGYKPIGILKMLFQAGKPIRISVTMVNILEVVSSGAGNVHAPAINTSRLVVNTSGVGNIAIDHLTADELDAMISGKGSITVAGKVRQERLSLSGVGSFRAGELESQTALVTIAGTGSALIWAGDSLNVGLSGVGSLEYYGNPRLKQRINGIGRVHSRGDRLASAQEK